MADGVALAILLMTWTGTLVLTYYVTISIPVSMVNRSSHHNITYPNDFGENLKTLPWKDLSQILEYLLFPKFKRPYGVEIHSISP